MPKRLTHGVVEDCLCMKSFEALREDYLKYYALGNVVGKHVIPTYEDYVLAGDFNFDMFTANYRGFFEHVGYRNVDEFGDYICKVCKGIYFIPPCDKTIS